MTAPHAHGRLGRLLAGSALALAAAAPLPAQDLVEGGTDGVRFESRVLDREARSHGPLIDTPGRYVVVNLTENRVFVFEGDRAIWSAPSGTGTGLRLERGEHRWKFSTPRGLMKVRRMEKDPIWYASDWHFIEKGLPVPPPDSPSRKIPGVMGTTAIYLGDGIAIHGTSQPELLMNPDPDKRRVSHGCIRLTNENARELMHMIDVGTPVLIF